MGKGVKEMTAIYATDRHVRNVFDEFGINLDTFIKETIRKKNIEMIVLGGNISQSLNLFRYSFSKNFTGHGKIAIQKSQLGENAALLGAVSLNTLLATL